MSTQPKQSSASPKASARNITGTVPVNEYKSSSDPVTKRQRLTEPQEDLLCWLNEGNYIEVCEHKTSRQQFKVGVNTLTGSRDHRTIRQLLRRGYVTATCRYHFGLMWNRYRINKQGVKHLESLEGI